MNMKRRLIVVLMVFAMVATLLPCVFASAADEKITGKGYMVGNSLTISMSPRRFAALLASQDYNVTLGGQLLGDTSLPEHIGVREVGTNKFTPWRRHTAAKPDGYAITSNTVMSDEQVGLNPSISGHYFTAMSQEAFDFATLQTYGSYANTHSNFLGYERDHILTSGSKQYYEYEYLGDRQAIGIMINHALQEKYENNKGCDTFLIYEAWTYQDKILASKSNFSDFYNANYYQPGNAGYNDILANTVVPNKNATEELMSGLRSDFSYLDESSIRLVPVAAVLAKLDELIRAGELKGFEEYMERNADYYIGARNTTNPEKQKQALLENAYVQEYGIINLYTDSVHMASFGIKYNGVNYNGYHWGDRDGTLASYITAVTMYSVLTGYSPVGLPVDTGSTNPKAQYVSVNGSDARLDTNLDAELIRNVQEVIFEVLCASKYTGITEDAPQRTASTSGHVDGNGGFVRVSTETLAKAPARIATELALTMSENPVWAPADSVENAVFESIIREEKKTKETL